MNDSSQAQHGSLAQLERAERMLAEVATTSDAVNIIDLAEVARVYAREAKLGTAAINHATSIKLRAERRLADIVDEGQAKGEIATAADGPGFRVSCPGGGQDTPLIEAPDEPARPATLDEIGVTRQRLSEARTIRDNYTEDDIAEIVEEANAADKIVPRTDFVKKKAHVANNTGQNEWYTPADYIQAARDCLQDEFGLPGSATPGEDDENPIELDPASSDIAQQTVMATTYYTEETDGLAHEWVGRVWMNPPYAQPLIGQFVEKLIESYRSGKVPAAIVLVNNGTETRWGQALLGEATHVCFPQGRIRFMDPEGNPGAPLQGQMIVYLGPVAKWLEHEYQGDYLYQKADGRDRSFGFREHFSQFGVVLGG